MLIEICCICGFVHKDSRILLGENIRYRGYKPHYHWIPESGELERDGLTLHATLCVACCGQPIDWKEFFEQKKMTPEKYVVKFSLNAPLPNRLLAWANDLYKLQATYFQFD